MALSPSFVFFERGVGVRGRPIRALELPHPRNSLPSSALPNPFPPLTSSFLERGFGG